jgi:hypothetical protein
MFPLSQLLPSVWKPSLVAAYGLMFQYAHLASVRRGACVDAANNPVPWYTYPAIEYLKQLDFAGRTVFEYGSGNSTLFWAGAGARVASVEDDETWYRSISRQLPSHCELTLETDLERYVATIDRYPHPFDVIVVDGAARGHTRLKCSRRALARLADGGMIILDNSDWLPESARVLRDAGLIQVDMTGFAPISGHTQTTSFFLHRSFAFKPRGPRQPMPGPGALDKVWERPAPTEPPLAECGGEVYGAVRRDERFAFATPAGRRTFRFIHACPSGRPEGTAIFDLDRDRVLIALFEPTRADVPQEQELAAAMAMPWTSFCRFINEHPKRRYALNADGRTD